MHFSLPLIIAAASLCTAAPVTITDSALIEKRADLIEVTPFYSGEWMNLDEIERGVNQWCAGKPSPSRPDHINILTTASS